MGESIDIPARGGWKALCRAAKKCRACPLWRNATQTVFGSGNIRGDFFLIGEQPGNAEDLAGEPFVGPAGKMLHEALEEAGITLDSCYVTNAVKHFKWKARGKRRLHKKPSAREIAACKPWLLAELQAVNPKTVICLGATAVRSLLGGSFKVMRDRGKILSSDFAAKVVITIHPSLLLRMPDRERAKSEYARFVEDLRRATD